MIAPTFDLYELLGVAPDASLQQIKTAYRQMARETHPDKGGDDIGRIWFEIATQAYEILGDPALRAAYDERREADVRDARQAEIMNSFEIIEAMARNLLRQMTVKYGGPEAIVSKPTFQERFLNVARKQPTWRTLLKLRRVDD